MDNIDNHEKDKKAEFKNLRASYDINYQIENNSLLAQIFSYAPVGLLVVDPAYHLYRTNQYVFSYFNREECQPNSQKFGNFFKCVQVNGEKKICGEQTGCQECIMRKCLVEVLEKGNIIPYTEFTSVFSIEGEWVRKYFTASAVPIESQGQRYGLITLIDITEQKSLEQKLKKEVITDSLTNVFNRRYMVEYIEQMLAEDGHELGIIIIDIDNFKKVNDQYGHLVGDQVLKHLARVVKTRVGKDGMVARYGGEEFVILFKGLDMEQELERLSEIRQELLEQLVPEYNQPVRFSGGLVHLRNGYLSSEYVEFKNSDQILKHCDDLLYQAKQNGKDQVMVKELFG